MFEDIKKEDEKVTVGSSGAVEDMFRDIDPLPDVKSAVHGGKLKPVAKVPDAPLSGQTVGPPRPLTQLSQIDEWTSKKSRSGMRFAIIALVAVVAIGATAFIVFSNRLFPQAPDQGELPQGDSLTGVPEPSGQGTGDEGIPDIPTNALIDSDGDGLADVEEYVFGTDPESADSDSDRISDRDEVTVYRTDPLLNDTDNDALNDYDEIFIWQTDPNNPDTDNDTYQDGAEIQNGYDPRGSGRLNPSALE